MATSDNPPAGQGARERYVRGHTRNLEDNENYLHSSHTLLNELVTEIKACLDPGSSVLEIGCGGGHAAALLASLGFKVVGTDFSPVAVETARGNYPQIDFREADACRLGFSDGSFDAVVAIELLEHLARPAEHVEEVRRLLKPGGSYFVKTPNRRLHNLYYRGQPEVSVWHPSVMSAPELWDLLAGKGFSPRFVRMLRMPEYQIKKLQIKSGFVSGPIGWLAAAFPIGFLPPQWQPSLMCVAIKQGER